MKKALLLCSTHNDLGLIFALRKLGYYIVVGGNKAGLPGQHLCDKFILADYSDKEVMLKIARDEHIDAVVACCNDFGVYTAAYIAEKLGLPGYDSYDVTLTLHNKDRFKKFALENGISTPFSKMFVDRAKAIEYAMNAAKLPIIVKPTDASAGNGISKVTSIDDIQKAIDFAFNKTRVGRIVIEPFIVGSQHGFCTFLKNRKVVAICSNNEYSIVNPYRVEIDTYPADDYEKVGDELVNQIEKIADLLNLKDGIFHLQYIVDSDGRPMIIEVMRRILGNMYHIPGNWLTGMNWEYWQTRVQCGLSIDDIPNGKQEGCFAYKAIMGAKNGTIADISIPDNMQSCIKDKYLLKHVGDEISNYLSEPVGFLFMMFKDAATMRNILIENYRNDLVTIT